ncbi:MAG: enoyl-CoA hydratase-related protein [bacterium]
MPGLRARSRRDGICCASSKTLALVCDLVIASERARFVSASRRIGLLPEVGTSWFLTPAAAASAPSSCCSP